MFRVTITTNTSLTGSSSHDGQCSEQYVLVENVAASHKCTRTAGSVFSLKHFLFKAISFKRPSCFNKDGQLYSGSPINHQNGAHFPQLCRMGGNSV